MEWWLKLIISLAAAFVVSACISLCYKYYAKCTGTEQAEEENKEGGENSGAQNACISLCKLLCAKCTGTEQAEEENEEEGENSGAQNACISLCKLLRAKCTGTKQAEEENEEDEKSGAQNPPNSKLSQVQPVVYVMAQPGA